MNSGIAGGLSRQAMLRVGQAGSREAFYEAKSAMLRSAPLNNLAQQRLPDSMPQSLTSNILLGQRRSATFRR